MLLRDVVKPRSDVLSGDFQGDLRAYRVGRESESDKLENNPEFFFDITYPTSSLRRIIERVHKKLTGEKTQGAFLPIGKMGSGKTHALVTLYNLFAYPEYGTRWLQQHGLPRLATEEGNARAVIVSAQEDQFEYLWESVFRRTGREDLLSEVRDYPTISQIKDLVGDGVLAVFIDEIEDWYDSIADDEVRRGKNRGFLQNLTEVATEEDYHLFVFISLLNRNLDLKNLLRRPGAIAEDMVAVKDRWPIIQHRLFASRDEEKARVAIEAYMEAYDQYAEDLTVASMVQQYPFHPSLFDTLKEIHAAQAQGIRDTLRTFASLTMEYWDRRDLLLASDLSPQTLVDIDPLLHNALREDIERCSDIRNTEPILSTIFFYSLRPSLPGARLSEIVQGLLRPGESINDIILPLQELDGQAFHLKSNGRFLLTQDVNVYAIVRSEAERVDPEEARSKIDSLIKEKVFNNNVYLLSEIQSVDDRRLKVVVSTRDLTETEVNTALSPLNWSNRVVLVVPKAFLGDGAVYDWGDNLENAKRVVAAETLLQGGRRDIDAIRTDVKEIRDEEDLPRLLEDLRGTYGRYVQWLTSGHLSKRTVEPNAQTILSRAVAGLDAAYDQILDVLHRRDFMEVKQLIDNFYRIRRYPMVEDRGAVEDALRELYRNREIGFKGLKKNYLYGNDAFPLFAEEGLSVARYELIEQGYEPEDTTPDEAEGDESSYQTGGQSGFMIGEGEEPGVDAGETITLTKETETLSLYGHTPFSLQEIGPEDEIRSITIEVDQRQLPMNKGQLNDLLDGLPERSALHLTIKVVRHG